MTSRLVKKIKSLTGYNLSSHNYKAANEQLEEYEFPSDTRFAKIFSEHKGRVAHKWDQYHPVYDQFIGNALRRFGPQIKLLEIGVSLGGSLELWRKFLGPDATVFGIDIDPNCAARCDPPNRVRIGSQDDTAFLETVIKEMNGVDVVIDDGSHIGRHQEASFRFLFPHLPEGGLYIIEDLHSAYWKGFEGGYKKAGTGIELIKSLIDDMHHNYHNKPINFTSSIASIYLADSIAVIEKRRPLKFRARIMGDAKP